MKLDTSLEERIAAAKSKQGKPVGQKPDQGTAWRFVSEIIAGLLVGGGIGWLLDNWLGSDPWFFIIFVLLGVAAAFWNMMKVASTDMKYLKSE